MMMERVKTASAPEEAAKPSTNPPPTETKPAPTTSQERVVDLERRLNDLDSTLDNNDGVQSSVVESAGAAKPEESATVVQKPELKPAEVKQPDVKPVELHPSVVKPTEQKQPAVGTGKNNPLLARIMAAQERARIAEQKEKEAKEAAAKAEAERRKSEDAAAIAAAKLKELQSMVETLERAAQANQQQLQQQQMQQQQQQHQQKTEQSQQLSQAQQKRDEILRYLQGVKPNESPTPTAAIPIMKSMDSPPPPPFDALGLVAPRPRQQHHVESEQSAQQMSPPLFDAIEQVLHKNPDPSAPPESPHDHLAGVVPMPAPVPPPPSFAEFEEQLQRMPPPETQIETDTSFDFDVDGIPLSQEERQQMLEEQRRLYENIMKEKAANDIAIARASADAFDSRSPAAASRAEARNEQMDSMGRDVDPRAAGGPKTEGEQTDINEPKRYVQIGGNQTVALHGQERTKKAIKEGTALLVQCINCQNWMQVTATATLMFCPVCQVVCPVVKQTEVLTKEQAIQLTMDRKLAEKLQAEAYSANDTKKNESGYFARLFGSGETSTASTTTAQAASGSQSWWDKLSSIVSYGVEEEPRQRGELGVTRPPGSSETNSSMTTYPGQRRPVLTPATVTGGSEETRGLLSTSPSNASSSMTTYPGQRRSVLTPATVNGGSEETRGLLSTSPSNASNLHPVVVHGNEAHLPAGRVAEQRPLLSCVYDSVSNVASSVFTNEEPDEDGNVYGVDARSLLAVTEREDDERGEMT